MPFSLQIRGTYFAVDIDCYNSYWLNNLENWVDSHQVEICSFLAHSAQQYLIMRRKSF